MFYIVLEVDGEKKVVATSNGHVREFPKRKKAQNFINGRAYLEVKNPQIVTEIDEIENRFKVDI
jgi:hypothetical protein